MSRPRILAIDDQPENLELLEALLSENDYEVVLASSAFEALEILEQELPQGILLDVMMPGLDGIELCRRLKLRRPTCFIPVIVLTALADVESKVRALDAGADDFLTKPFAVLELLTRLRTLLRIRRLREERDSIESVLFSMIELLEGKSSLNAQHSLRVARLVAAAAQAAGFRGSALSDLVLGAALHDLGKLGVPDQLLEVPERELGPAARDQLRQHVAIGTRILQPIASLRGALPYLRHHHERLDGSGYPEGLAGDAFSPEIELIAVANAWDRARILAEQSGPDPSEVLRAEVALGRFRATSVDRIMALGAAANRPMELEQLLPAPEPSQGGHILVVDDSQTNRQLYVATLEGAGYRTTALGSGTQALEAWLELQPDLLLLDHRLPDKTGIEICREVKQNPLGQFLPILLVTAYEEAGSRRRAMDAQADDLLIAPVHRIELVARIRSLLRLKLYSQDLIDHESVVRSLSAALEAKDPWTQGHSQRVGEIAAVMARKISLPTSEEERFRLAGLLHDLGKIAVPERVLHKESVLSREEWSVVATHPEIGYRICRRLRSALSVLDAIRFHHERLDGSGYPLGLVGNEIPFDARLLALADAYEALTADRPYRPRLSPEEAIALLQAEAQAGKWDRELLPALEQAVVEGFGGRQ